MIIWCPPITVPLPTKNEDEVLNGFIQGMGTENKHQPFLKVPWYAWKRPLMFWLPIILALWIGLVGLSVVVHRQWSDHEHLPYPVANFANSLLPDEGKSKSSIFTNKIFRIGAVIVFIIHINNYLFTWFPHYLLKIPTTFDFQPLASLFPAFERGRWRNGRS